MIGFWIQFFKDAGIPSAAVKSYAGIFEENRITKDMLLDLNKEILLDMGIKVMGDLISILKHARKVYNQELKRKEKLGPTGADATAQIPAVSTTMSGQGQANEHDPLGTSSTAGVSTRDEWTTEADETNILPPLASSHLPTEPVQGVGDIERYHPVVNTATHHGTLRSDQILLGNKPSRLHYDAPTDPPVGAEQAQSRYQEEYTTAAYENRMRRKRGMYADEMESPRSDSEVSPPKQTRRVVAPKPKRVVDGDSPTGLGTQQQQRAGTLFSQKVLEAAGLHSRVGLDASRVVQSTQSVFQRLDRSGKETPQGHGAKKGTVTRDVTVEAKKSKLKPDVRSRLVTVKSSKASLPRVSLARREATMVADKVEQKAKTTVHLRVDRARLGSRKDGGSF